MGWAVIVMDTSKPKIVKYGKASATYGIPSTTLWQRAHRLGIDTPKKEGASKSWSEADLRGALHALRAGAISANKASKAYGIPSSTLYKIARREGIRLAAPFNAAPTSWRRADLERALQAIRCGAASVQRAATQFGIPTGTLYGRCKREGIELSRSNPTPWSEDAMGEALEAVRVGQMSINQAAIHYNLPYSSLYGRFKRCKYPPVQNQPVQQDIPTHSDTENQPQDPYYQQMSHAMLADELQSPYVHDVDTSHIQYAQYYAQCNVSS
ncbi:jg9708 [Pararge aegeria aegeria]|uniref:Jg9708 protein n=1 Tax=Pararge aegeria aegeria TaxID=348720 RepID=A0A8S4SQK3_9NEOP|nr:jg9708 [Pararge aegeria aegeria]